MVITRATEYAIRALLYMSQQPRGEIVYKKDICQTQDITPAFLTKILQPLIKARIVGSQRGVGGGFFLLRSPEEITLLDVVMAEEGPLNLNQCLVGDGVCERDVFCSVHSAWHEVQEKLLNILGSYTFAQLASQEHTNLESLRTRRNQRGASE